MGRSPWVSVCLYDEICVNLWKVVDKLAYWPIAQLIFIDNFHGFCVFSFIKKSDRFIDIIIDLLFPQIHL